VTETKRSRPAKAKRRAKPRRKATAKKPRAKKATGRPKVEFDLEAVESLSALQITQEELAAVLGVHRDTITRRLREDDAFSAAYTRGQDAGKVSVKRALFSAATRKANPNVTAMIFWGKQYLGWRDRQEVLSTDELEDFRQQFSRAGVELVEGIRRGSDSDELLQRFIATVRSIDEETSDAPPPVEADGSSQNKNVN
jgi:predicted DNA-binding protein (UPF0251 family)